MNIFVLHKDPYQAAYQMCDKHVVKMILESAQMLCSAFPNGDAPYKRAFYNHPCTKWSRESLQNYHWLLDHANGLLDEYSDRYIKFHKSSSAIKWCEENHGILNLPSIGLTQFAQAMPDEYKNDCAVKAYRDYYNGEKAHFAKWDRQDRLPPKWFIKKEAA